ncbi:MAG: glutamate--tRNA ligase [Enterobacterales bacterium]
MTIKTRFAPSPTGFLHLGNIRTALYAWLFAKINKGKFLLRIEDTDLNRLNQNSIQYIINSINWLNIDYDEKIYLQSNRLKRYQFFLNKLLNLNLAYKCYCSEKRLYNLRKLQMLNKQKPRYDRLCINNTNKKINKPYVIRFKNPKTGSVIFNDIIYGKIKFNNEELDDFIIKRTNGSFTYNFCVIVDDYDMSITHVIRGSDHINNTPRQINIIKAIGAPIPFYIHIPIIFNHDGTKLSKRNGSMGIMEYRDCGFLPEAILNYLVKLGWSDGNREIFSLNNLKKVFNLNSINKSSSRLNLKKLLWINHFYIKNLPEDKILKHLIWHFNNQRININNGPSLKNILMMFKNKYKTLKEIVENCKYFYEDFSNFNYKNYSTYLNKYSIKILKYIRNKLLKINKWDEKLIKYIIQKASISLNISMKDICMPLRIALTQKRESPSMYLTIYNIGKLRSIQRINMALSFIQNL